MAVNSDDPRFYQMWNSQPADFTPPFPHPTQDPTYPGSSWGFPGDPGFSQPYNEAPDEAVDWFDYLNSTNQGPFAPAMPGDRDLSAGNMQNSRSAPPSYPPYGWGWPEQPPLWDFFGTGPEEHR